MTSPLRAAPPRPSADARRVFPHPPALGGHLFLKRYAMSTFEFKWDMSDDQERRVRATGLSHIQYVRQAVALYRLAVDEAFAGGQVKLGDRPLADNWFGPNGAKLVAEARAKSTEDAARKKIVTLSSVIAASL